MAEDPGWGTKRFLYLLIPGEGRRLRRAGEPTILLLVLRHLFIILAAPPACMPIVVLLLAVTGDDLGDVAPAVAGGGVAVASVLGLLGVRHFATARLDCESEASLFHSYRERAFRIALCFDVPTFAGFVGFVLSGRPWVFLVGWVGSIVGFVMGAPTSPNLRRDEQALARQGCGRSLMGTLTQATDAEP